MLEALLAFAIATADYKELCASTACTAPTVIAADVDGVAMFHPDEPTVIRVSKHLKEGSIEWQSAIVHEYVHYLQWKAGKIGAYVGCEQRLKLEREAYHTESAFLLRHGIDEDFADRIFGVSIRCSTDM